jgi:hypothetical protein
MRRRTLSQGRALEEIIIMPMKELKIPAGTTILIGSPAQPMKKTLSSAIGKLTGSIDKILEAHLPQMFAIGVMEEPAQVLVLVLTDQADFPGINEQLATDLPNILPKGMHLDVWPISLEHQLLDDIRGSDCQL